MYARTGFFHKVRPDAGRKLYPRRRTGAKRLSVLELSLDNTEEKEEICFADWVLSELSFKIKKR